MGRPRQRVPADIAAAVERVEHWRETRAGPGRMPESLWSTAVRLARVHGVSQVAHFLRLDYYSLKGRLDAVPAVTDDRRSGPLFVELGAPHGSSTAQCVLEFEDRRGRRMTLQVPGGVDVVALAEAFWRRRGCSR